MIFNYDTMYLVQNFIVLFTAISVHEYAHGKVAYMLGDPTAKSMGRLTLNPLAHLDPVGALMMIFCRFGWAKAVPVNPYYFSNPKKGMILVSLAGPLANVAMAFIASTLMAVCMFIISFFSVSIDVYVFIFGLFSACIQMNICFAVFNLIPFPPLDGSKILFSVLPNDKYNALLRYEQVGLIVLLLLSFTDILGKILGVITEPVINLFFMWFDLLFNVFEFLRGLII